MLFKHRVWESAFKTKMDGFDENIYIVFHPMLLNHVKLEIIENGYKFSIDTPIKYSVEVKKLIQLRKVLRDALEKYLVSSSENEEEREKFVTYFHLTLITNKTAEETQQILKEHNHKNEVIDVTEDLKKRIEEKINAEQPKPVE